MHTTQQTAVEKYNSSGHRYSSHKFDGLLSSLCQQYIWDPTRCCPTLQKPASIIRSVQDLQKVSGDCRTADKLVGEQVFAYAACKKKKDLNSYRRFCLLHTYHDTTLCSLMFCLALFCLKLLIPDKTICVTFICNSQKWLQLCKTQKVTYHPTICICSYGTEEHSIGPFLSK